MADNVYHKNWITIKSSIFLICIILLFDKINIVRCDEELLSACEHLRSAEFRRAKSFGDVGRSVRIPRCSKLGDFEPIQCSNNVNSTDCWCVDEYGVEIAGSRRDSEKDVNCTVVDNSCSASSCRMFCPSGFSRDLRTGCPICECRDPCSGVDCPGGLACQPQEVKCKKEPCPPIPTCKRARSLFDLCPAGQPLSISETTRPFLCGTDPGKPQCPPLYKCLVQSGNDYGVCCPASLEIKKPGTCPVPEDSITTENTGFMCGTPCGHDLECPSFQKCCYNNGCGNNCRQPFNVTECHQAKMLSEILSVNEREGRGYIPQCNEVDGLFSIRQCSRNGLVCWCVDQNTGYKIKGSMGAANMVSCNDKSLLIQDRSNGRSFDNDCDKNICAAICEYGFKIDHRGCSTCECSDPCEGFLCASGSHCEVAKDPQCTSGSSLCASEPICQPDIITSNPCDFGTPMVDNKTMEVIYCRKMENKAKNRARAFFEEEDEEVSSRGLNNGMDCPTEYECTKLHGETKNVCCLRLEDVDELNTGSEERQQSMCEYLRDFTDKMEGTEEGMTLAIPTPTCNKDGSYESSQCQKKKILAKKSEVKLILEKYNIRQMRKLLENSYQMRPKRDTTSLMNTKSDKLEMLNQMQIPDVDVINYLTNKLMKPIDEKRITENDSELETRFAKLINFSTSKQQTIENEDRPKTKDKMSENEMKEIEIEECWCVDGFGTEIPKTRSENTTIESCNDLRQSLECLDLTCRMGCDYGFILDPVTQCPSCECRDPCYGVICGDSEECRTVEVSCEGEYCAPVPACLPRKPGQCPFLIPPGNEGSNIDFCEYECRSDYHCEGNMRCCSNGCGTQCVNPQLKTACQHLQAIQIHQTVELGIPAKQKYIAQCDENDGSWREIQCGPDNICWCVDEMGNEKSGTRNIKDKINCNGIESKMECPLRKCHPCEHGYLFDENGCRSCECRNPCKGITCPGGEVCELVQIECTDSPCPKMPICAPIRDSICTEGIPLKSNDREVNCGPQSDTELCPSTHSCQINPMTNKGVCCSKTRDVCFESQNGSCIYQNNDTAVESVTRWRFSPKLNKCVSMSIAAASTNLCQTKNLFHSESACKSVCPVLSQCERLRLKNTLAAKKSGQDGKWFLPDCDPETGHWGSIQCLKQQMDPKPDEFGLNVCWCSDKKGAPLKGSLTRGGQPKCNHRQARRRMGDDDDIVGDPVLEQLIQQMTMLSDNDLFDNEEMEINRNMESNMITEMTAVTEKILILANTIENVNYNKIKKVDPGSTRCQSLKLTASFPVECDDNGSFLPTQCNDDVCWCVNSAGNQLPYTNTFKPGTLQCTYTPIDLVEIELHLNNPRKISLKDVYETLKYEIKSLLGYNPENLRVHENIDGSILLRFNLVDDTKIDTAFAIEEMVKHNSLLLYNKNLIPDLTQSRFLHRNANLPMPQRSVGFTENTFHMIIFVLATGSAFLVSIFVIYIMLKRGRNKMSPNKFKGNGDRYLDYSSPIFVLSANEKSTIKSEVSN